MATNQLYPDYLEVYACDETYIAVDSDQRGIIQNLSEFFTYEIKNARFHPKVKSKVWDGKIRMLCWQTQRLYKGLLPYIVKFCEDRDIECRIEEGLLEECEQYSDQELDDFISSLGLVHEPYDFQVASFKMCVRSNRMTLLSPTSSGKSLIMYMLIRWYMQKCSRKILLTVPTITLTSQLLDEFREYAPHFDIAKDIHLIMGGESKVSDKKIYISTWQSVYQQPKKYYKLFDAIIIDEAHTAQADSLKGMLEKSTEVKYRFGLTGTLDDLKYNRLIIEGLTGPVHRVTTTKELMDKGIISQLKIKCAILKYNSEVRGTFRKSKYPQEMAFISEYKPRTKLICDVAKSIDDDKNLLILVEWKKHQKQLVDELEGSGKTVYVVHGDTPDDEREAIRKRVEHEKNVVIVATYGVFSTGINIKNLQYVMFASSSKSLIRVLQSIGRGLRKDGIWNKMILLDVVDDFSYVSEHENRKNYILRHFFERVKIYTKEEFDYEMQYINIE